MCNQRAVSLENPPHRVSMQLESFEPNLGSIGRIRGERISIGGGRRTFTSRSAVVIAQHAAETLAPAGRSIVLRVLRHDQPVAETIVVSLAMIMGNQLANTFAQRALTE